MLNGMSPMYSRPGRHSCADFIENRQQLTLRLLHLGDALRVPAVDDLQPEPPGIARMSGVSDFKVGRMTGFDDAVVEQD
jgi:hypothetical protein